MRASGTLWSGVPGEGGINSSAQSAVKKGRDLASVQRRKQDWVCLAQGDQIRIVYGRVLRPSISFSDSKKKTDLEEILTLLWKLYIAV